MMLVSRLEERALELICRSREELSACLPQAIQTLTALVRGKPFHSSGFSGELCLITSALGGSVAFSELQSWMARWSLSQTRSPQCCLNGVNLQYQSDSLRRIYSRCFYPRRKSVYRTTLHRKYSFPSELSPRWRVRENCSC